MLGYLIIFAISFFEIDNTLAGSIVHNVTLVENKALINDSATFSSIQSAINVSSKGDTVLVSPGTYYENINFNGKNITAASYFITTNYNQYISKTVIDGTSHEETVLIRGVE